MSAPFRFTQVVGSLALSALALTLHAQTSPSFEIFPVTSAQGSGTAVGDFNQDGKPDFVAGYHLWLGNGDGTFEAPTALGAIHSGGFIGDLAVGDVNGDGKLDAVLLEQVQTSTSSTSYIDVFFGNGDGTFQPAVSFLTPNYGLSVAIGNFTGNGLLDIAVGDAIGNVELYLNQGGKTFVPGKTIPVSVQGAQYISVTSLRAGDIDDDGITDLAAAGGRTAFVLWGDGTGNFNPVQLESPTFESGNLLVTVGDVNQDGAQDVIVSFDCGTSQEGSRNSPVCTQIDVFYGQGKQTTFYRQAVVDTTNNLSGLLGTSSIYPVDINGDGIADLVGTTITDRSSGALAVYFGHPDGSFDQNATTFVASNEQFGGAPGDFNRDGKMDFGGPGVVLLNATPTAPCATSEINPTVTVCAPVNNAYLPGTFQIDGTTYDKNTVTALQEYIDGKLVYNQPVTTFNIPETEPVGGHLLVTKAWDSTGLNFRSDRRINIFNGTPGYSCPVAPESAAICLPSGSSSSSPVHILANAATDGIPTSVQLYIDNSLVIDNTQGETTAIDTTQTLAAGSHYLVFKMYDSSGAVFTASKTVTVQ